MFQWIVGCEPRTDERRDGEQPRQENPSCSNGIAGDIGQYGTALSSAETLDEIAHRKVILGSIAAQSRSVIRFTSTTKNANTTKPACTIA